MVLTSSSGSGPWGPSAPTCECVCIPYLSAFAHVGYHRIGEPDLWWRHPALEELQNQRLSPAFHIWKQLSAVEPLLMINIQICRTKCTWMEGMWLLILYVTWSNWVLVGFELRVVHASGFLVFPSSSLGNHLHKQHGVFVMLVPVARFDLELYPDRRNSWFEIPHVEKRITQRRQSRMRKLHVGLWSVFFW